MFALFPEIVQVASSGDLESLACLVRKYFADRQIYSPKLRVEPLLLKAGFDLSRDTIQDAACLRAADHRGAWHVSIVLSPTLQEQQDMNFTLAHLFGHFLCEIQPLMARGELRLQECKERMGALRRYLSRSSSAPEEAQADAFAMALLMPIGMVKRAFETLGTINETAAFFDVRKDLMERRLENLQLLPKSRAAAKVPILVEPPLQTSGPVVQAKLEKSGKPLISKGPDSLIRVQKSQAALSYRREEEATRRAHSKTNLESSSEQSSNTPESGLERLRAIARKIDRSVDG
ncbi:MAG: ImmA/IrrE family metallo-endopeptidase [Proteobacteria bacterium]|nr:ImmA/IrrE family metallo-endopeptidase [Pseudomonadota bacterium]